MPHPLLAVAATVPHLLLLLALGALPAPAEDGGADPASEARALPPDGTPQAVRLETGANPAVFRLEVRAGARSFLAVVAADVDVDLFVDAEALPADRLSEAEHRETSVAGLEFVRVGPPSEEAFDEDRTWFLHVYRPGTVGTPVEASVAALVARDDPEPLLPDRRTVVTVPAGKRAIERALLLPGRLAAAVVLAEAADGIPALRVSRDRIAVEGLRWGTGSFVRLAARPSGEVPSGLWRVIVGRPPGADLAAALDVALEASLATSVAPADRRSTDDPLPLAEAADGPPADEGQRVIEMEKDAAVDAFLDVGPGVRAIEVTSRLVGADVDLYASRHGPVRGTEAGDWEWGGWRTGDDEVLRVGGRGALPPGRYWLRVAHAGGDAGQVSLTWRVDRDAAPDAAALASEGPLGEGTVWDVRFPPAQGLLWWDLLPGVGPGAHVQVLGSDKDVDLLLARADSGALVQWKVSPRNDEYLQIAEDLLLPRSAGLRLALCRWQIVRPVSAGEIHVDPTRRVLPPACYLPPYAAWGQGSQDRILAASVEVSTDDGSGSGVVVAPSGLLLTCHHVVEDVLAKGGPIRLAFPTGPRGRPRQAFEARVLESDEELDLALLAPTTDVFGRPLDPARPLAFVPVGDPAGLTPGAPLRVAGYAYAGSTAFTSNLLLLSGTLAGVEAEAGEAHWLITDARLGAGNSGGGYFDAAGRLVALHSRGVGNTGSELGYGRPTSMLPPAWRERIRAAGGSVAGP